MSTLAQRRAYAQHWQAINNMAAAACGIKPVTEADWIAADLADNRNKAARRHQANDAAAFKLQIQTQDKVGSV